MAGLNNLIGVLLTSGMTPSGDTRLGIAMNSSGLVQSGGLLEKTFGAANRGRTGTDVNRGSYIFSSVLKIATSVLGMTRQSPSTSGLQASPGLSVFTDTLFCGTSGAPAKESSFGGAMAMLAGLASLAFNNMNRQSAGLQTVIACNDTPLGLRAPVTALEEKELEQTATLVLKGMINAAKAGRRMEGEDIQKIIGRIRASDSDEGMQQLIFNEMQRPLDLDGLVNEIPNETVAAQVYAASLFVIEVDTPAERHYLEQFVQRTGLDIGVALQIRNAVGACQVGVYF